MLSAIGCAALTSIGFAAGWSGKPTMLSDSARKAIEGAFPNAPMRSIEREQRSIEAFEVELFVENREIEVLITADGTMIQVDRSIDLGNLPAVVREGLAKIAAGAALQEIEEIQLQGELKVIPLERPRTVYQAEIVVDGQERTFTVDETGKLLRGNESQDDEDDNDENEAND